MGGHRSVHGLAKGAQELNRGVVYVDQVTRSGGTMGQQPGTKFDNEEGFVRARRVHSCQPTQEIRGRHRRAPCNQRCA